MQTQSRLAASGGSSSSASASEEEHEAVIRELTRGHELTAQLRAEALRALRGQGQAEATAAFILQEVSRAFTVCLSIMGSPARAPPPPAPAPEMTAPPALLAAAPRRSRDDSIPRERRTTSSPHYDGYQWRKYGQKRINRTQYPRCYFRCSFHRERNCRATKQVQQRSSGDPPQYDVMYFNEHTCDTAAWEPAAAAAANPGTTAATLDDLSALLASQGARAPLQEEHERRVLVLSLARVLGGQQLFQQSPGAGSGTGAVNVARAQAQEQEQEQEPQARTRDAPAPSPPGVDAPGDGEMPRINDEDVAGLDVMDYDVTGELYFGDSYDLLPLSQNTLP